MVEANGSEAPSTEFGRSFMQDPGSILSAYGAALQLGNGG
jgi:hypothetical protein